MGKLKLQIEHAAISVNNIEESAAWYQDVFDLKMVSCKTHPEIASKVAVLVSQEMKLELFQHDKTMKLPDIRRDPQTDIQQQGMKHICVATKDLENTIRLLQEKHVEIVLGPDVFENQRFIYIRDINGILIEIMERHK